MDTREQSTPGTPDDSGAQQHDQRGDERSRNAEAARYRVERNEARAERDQLREQLAAMRRAEAERLATSGHTARLHAGADLWAYGVDVDEMVDDDGRVDPALVTAAVERITDGREHLRADRTRPRPDPSQGARGDADRTPAVSWSDVIRGR